MNAVTFSASLFRGAGEKPRPGDLATCLPYSEDHIPLPLAISPEGLQQLQGSVPDFGHAVIEHSEDDDSEEGNLREVVSRRTPTGRERESLPK